MGDGRWEMGTEFALPSTIITELANHMTIATSRISLSEFLDLPDTNPASEFIDGQIIPKPMPQGEHSTIQTDLAAAINQVAKAAKIARAYTELRCLCGQDATVPDIVVFYWDRIPVTETGRVANRFDIPPDWSIEILSPGQSQTLVMTKIFNCLANGTKLAWLIDPSESAILVITPDRRVDILTGASQLPVLEGIELVLTPTEIFSWLKL
jgi:Uma2 family endonuclease